MENNNIPVFKKPLWKRQWFRSGFIFILGALAGFFLFMVVKPEVNRQQGKSGAWSGTMTKPRSFNEMKVADVLLFQDQDVKAACNARYSEERVEIHLEVTSAQRVTSILEFDVSSFGINTIEPVTTNNQSSTLMAANSINLNTVGVNRYIIYLYNKKAYSEDIGFRMMREDQMLYNNVIRINR